MYARVFRNPNFLAKLRNLRSYHDGHHMTKLEIDLANKNVMDLLPKPKGSWAQLNEQRQKVNNLTLIAGSALFVFSMIATFPSLFGDVWFTANTSKMNKDFPGAKFADA